MVTGILGMVTGIVAMVMVVMVTETGTGTAMVRETETETETETEMAMATATTSPPRLAARSCSIGFSTSVARASWTSLSSPKVV
jgi:hypothetical protein